MNATATPGFCPDKIPARAKYLILAEAPGSHEIAQAEPVVGKAGFVLKQWGLLAVPHLKLAWERGEVGLANTLRCLPPMVQGRPYPKGQTKDLAEAHCRQYDQFPSTIQTYILAGEHAQRLLFKPELDAEDATDRSLKHDLKGVGGRIGRVYERAGVRYVFAPHPAWVLRQPALVQHLQESLKIAANTERVVEPDYLPWHRAVQEIA